MADLYKALRNAHNAGDTESATRIAKMIKSQQQTEQAPTGAATSDDTSSLNYAIHHPIESFSALGKDLALGASHWLTTDHSTGQETVPQGASHDWYVQNMADPETRQNALASENALKMGAQVAAYTGGAGLVDSLGMGAVKSFLGSNIAGSLASQVVGGEDLSLGQTAEDVATAAILHGTNRLISTINNKALEALPERFGGYSTAQKAADVANPEYVSKVLQNDNPEAQYNYRMATHDDAGNSILTPSQTMNTNAGKKYIAAEQRELKRGVNSEYQNRYDVQKSGESLTRAVENPLIKPKNTLQESAQNIVNNFKNESSQLYNDSKTQAQSILDNANVKQLKLNNTKSLAAKHLSDDFDMGKVNLNASTRRTLQQFQNAKINNIDTLDKWKRALNEQASAQYRSGNHTSSQVLRDVSNSLKGEADRVISSIDPTAGSIYRDADKYYSQSVGDYGNKSVLGKIASKDNPDTAANALFNSQDAQYNTREIVNSLRNSMNNGILNDSHQLSANLSEALGQEARNRAILKGSSGENFSNTKFVNALHSYKPQINEATDLGNESLFSMSNQKGINDALIDAVRTYRSSNPVKTPIHDAIAHYAGKGIGGAIGGTVGSSLPIVGSTGGFLAGQHVGGKVSDALNKGFLDDVFGTNKSAQKYINFLSDPQNARTVQDILDSNGTISASKDQLMKIVDSLARYQSAMVAVKNQQPKYAGLNNSSVEPTYIPVEALEPDQHAQVDHRPNTSQNAIQSVTERYRGFYI